MACSKEYGTGNLIYGFDMEIISNHGGSSIDVSDEISLNILRSNHMGGSIENISYIIIKNGTTDRFIITGDIDEPNELMSNLLLDKNEKILIFHDMGWTGVPQEYDAEKAHPREEEVYSMFGNDKRLIGIHTDADLKYYEKAIKNKIYKI